MWCDFKIVSVIGKYLISGANHHFSLHLRFWKPSKEDFELETSILQVVVTFILFVGGYEVFIFLTKVWVVHRISFIKYSNLFQGSFHYVVSSRECGLSHFGKGRNCLPVVWMAKGSLQSLTFKFGQTARISS